MLAVILEFPNEAFIAKIQFERITRPDEALYLVGSFDVLGSSERQAGFLWQVSSSAFDDIEFLDLEFQSYWRFLLLKPRAQKEQKILIPI
jgi:hypothetical protein